MWVVIIEVAHAYTVMNLTILKAKQKDDSIAAATSFCQWQRGTTYAQIP